MLDEERENSATWRSKNSAAVGDVPVHLSCSNASNLKYIPFLTPSKIAYIMSINDYIIVN